MRTVLVAALVLLASLPLLSPTSAHTGVACGAVDGRLEAECFDRADADCDPDHDDEHTTVVSDATMSGGKGLFLPSDGCGAEFDDVVFSVGGRPDAFRFRLSGSTQTVGIEILVFVDGVLAARGAGTASGAGGPLVTVTGAPAGVVGPGTHDVRLEFHVTSGSSYHNLYLDYVDLTPSTGPREEVAAWTAGTPGVCVLDGLGCVRSESFYGETTLHLVVEDAVGRPVAATVCAPDCLFGEPYVVCPPADVAIPPGSRLEIYPDPVLAVAVCGASDASAYGAATLTFA